MFAFFFGTLFVFDYSDPARVNNRLRMEHARLLMDALEKYHKARGTYPAGNSVDDLKKDLVDGGYLKAIPSDPARSSKGMQYLYVSDGTKAYGLLISREPEPFLTGKKAGGLCVVGVKINGSGAWGDPPEC